MRYQKMWLTDKAVLKLKDTNKGALLYRCVDGNPYIIGVLDKFQYLLGSQYWIEASPDSILHLCKDWISHPGLESPQY